MNDRKGNMEILELGKKVSLEKLLEIHWNLVVNLLGYLWNPTYISLAYTASRLRCIPESGSIYDLTGLATCLGNSSITP
jgi:hypothetical protein